MNKKALYEEVNRLKYQNQRLEDRIKEKDKIVDWQIVRIEEREKRIKTQEKEIIRLSEADLGKAKTEKEEDLLLRIEALEKENKELIEQAAENHKKQIIEDATAE